MGAAVLLGKLATGFVDAQAEVPVTEGPARLASAKVVSRIKGKPMGNVTPALRSAISLAGSPHVAGAASLFPLRRTLAGEFRPKHLSDSTDLFQASFDIRGVLYHGGIEAHLTFTVEQDPEGTWALYQVTPTTGYPGMKIEDKTVVRAIAAATLQGLTSRTIKPGLPWEPGVLVGGSRVIEALRELLKQSV